MQDVVVCAEIFIRGCCFGWFARRYLRKKKTALYASMLYCFIMSVLYFMPLVIKAGAAYITGIVAVFILFVLRKNKIITRNYLLWKCFLH